MIDAGISGRTDLVHDGNAAKAALGHSCVSGEFSSAVVIAGLASAR